MGGSVTTGTMQQPLRSSVQATVPTAQATGVGGRYTVGGSVTTTFTTSQQPLASSSQAMVPSAQTMGSMAGGK